MSCHEIIKHFSCFQKHFEDSCYEQTASGKRKLKGDAVPTLFSHSRTPKAHRPSPRKRKATTGDAVPAEISLACQAEITGMIMTDNKIFIMLMKLANL